MTKRSLSGKKFQRYLWLWVGTIVLCFFWGVNAQAQQTLSVERMATLEKNVQGFSGLRSTLAETSRPIRVLAILSEKAVSESDSISQPAKLRGLSQATLATAATKTTQLLQAKGVSNISPIEGLPLVTFQLNADQLAEVAESGQFAAVVEDKLAKPYLASSGPVMNVAAAQALGARGAGRAVAVLDTGVDIDHPFLNGRVVEGACYSSTFAPHGSTSLCPGGATSATTLASGNHCSGVNGCAHGTHVAGIVAGRQTASIPFNGVAPDAGIMAVQVFSRFDDVRGGPMTCASVGTSSPCILSYTSDQIRGLQRVLDRAAARNIVAANMSLGGGSFAGDCDATETATKGVIDLLRAAGVATVIASGNESLKNAVGAPGCISTAVTVSSTTDSDAISGFSNMSSTVDLLAIGSSVDSSVPGTGTANFNGTSMATPQVAGAFAALASLPTNPDIGAIELALVDHGVSVTDSRSGGSVTKNRMNLEAAALALDSTPPTPTLPPEDCLNQDPDNLRLVSRGWWFWRTWTIVDGNSQLFYFGRNQSEARETLAILKHYKFDQTCYVGRPDPSMQYLKVSGSVPSGTMGGEDCINFNHANTQIEPAGSQWRMVDGSMSMLMFPNKTEAEHALAFVKHYRMNRQCFVGRPDPSFTYWLAE